MICDESVIICQEKIWKFEPAKSSFWMKNMEVTLRASRLSLLFVIVCHADNPSFVSVHAVGFGCLPCNGNVLTIEQHDGWLDLIGCFGTSYALPWMT